MRIRYLVPTVLISLALVLGACAGGDVEPRGSGSFERVGQISFITSDSDPVIDLANLSNRIDIDADNDSSLRASADDTIDIEVNGEDVYQLLNAQLILHDADASDFQITFDGNAQDYYIALDDSSDDLVFGLGSVVDTTETMRFNGAANLTLHDTTAADFIVIFDGNAQDFYIALDDSSDDLQIGAGSTVDTTELIKMSLTQLTLGIGQSIAILDTPAAGAGGDLIDITDTLAIMDGADTFQVLDINLTGANHTGTGNIIQGITLNLATNDAQAAETALVVDGSWDRAADFGSLPVVSTAAYWFDDFFGDAVRTQYTEFSGADGQAVQAIVEEQFGVYQLTSGDVGDTPANDIEGIALSLEWQADQGSLILEARLHMDASVTTAAMCVGLNDDVTTDEMPFIIGGSDVVTSNASDGVAFCFDTDADTDEWFFLGVDSNTDATGNAATGTAPAADTYQILRIEVDTAGAVCRGYINGTLEITLTANCVTNTIALAPWIAVDSHEAASHIVDIDYIYVSADRN